MRRYFSSLNSFSSVSGVGSRRSQNCSMNCSRSSSVARRWKAVFSTDEERELLDELFALFVRGEAMEGGLLLIGDDVDDVFVQPFLVRGFQLFAQFFVALALLFVGQRLGDGFTRRSGIRLLLIVLWSRCLILANRIPGQHQTEGNTGPQTAF